MSNNVDFADVDLEKSMSKRLTKQLTKQEITNELGPVTTRHTLVARDEAEWEELHEKMRLEESGNDIEYRTMSWQKTAMLLFGEYICLAILSFAWSFYYLGYFPALVINVGVGLLTYYTSYTLWQYVMLHPGVRDITDIGFLLFGESKVAREITAFGLLANNIMIMGFHVLTGSKILNTDSNHAICTTGFVLIFLVVCIIASLPRTLNHISTMATISAIFMGLSILLTMIFAGVESHPGTGPAGTWPAAGPVKSSAWPTKGVTFVTAMNAALNMTFTWAGQVCYPSFINEMKNPRDFPKALKVLTALEMIIFCVFGVVGYAFLGQYAGAPAVSSLSPSFKKVAFTFALIPTVVIGVIYASVVNKFIFNRIAGNSTLAHSHSLRAWGVWALVVVSSWVMGMIIAEVIPSFGDLLSLVSALFGAWFGYIFWAIAYWQMNRHQLFNGARRTATTCLNIGVLIFGLFMFAPGTYTSVVSIKNDMAASGAHPFSCADNAI